MVVDTRLQKILDQKIGEILRDVEKIRLVSGSLEGASTGDFAYGVLVGRLYNSFHYQCRRILGRNPNDSELSELAEILKRSSSEMRRAWN